tara:strand:- start:570 stop:899 length:330 start_codon:yes stop_codon:yes gene_type:complete
MSRYREEIPAINNDKQYEDLFEERGVRLIEQYRTPQFKIVSEETLKSIDVYKHIWIQGDSFWSLASRYYQAPEYWWIIASYNRKPTESHIKIGDQILIPADLYSALRVI